MGKLLDIYEFGSQLLETRDLDPVYVVLHEAQLEPQVLKQWCLAYFCFYHVGTASWIVDEGLYWKAMATAAGSKEWPRSSERRHYRGQAALDSVAWLRQRGVDDLFEPLWGKAMTATAAMQYVRTWKNFGPWISFKVADIMERLGVANIRFNEDEVMYDSPQKAAETLWANEMDDEERIPDAVGEWAIHRVLGELGKRMAGQLFHAPPRYERLLGPQEAETVLCKWKSYLNGHYEVGKDIKEIHHGLERFKSCSTAQRLLAAGKRTKLW